MLLRRGCILLSFFSRAPSLSAQDSTGYRRSVFGYLLPIHSRRRGCLSINQMRRCFSTDTAVMVQEQPSSKKKARRHTPEGILRHKFDMCSRNGDVDEALRLYDEAKRDGIPLMQHHYNILLYLCSSISNGSVNPGLERGLEIFKQMRADEIDPNEATFTSLARLAAAKDDPDMAFDSVKQMKKCGIPPKLRSYGPALFGFCSKGMADKAYEVDTDMIEAGVLAEESELSALLKVSAESKRELKVYETLHRLRASVRQVTEETCGVIEDWFKSDKAEETGEVNWDMNKVKEGIVSGGGGWHGQGWLGSGKWKVVKTHMNESGVCQSCGEKLVSIDIDPKETQHFAASLANLACQREARADFLRFQDWLQRYGPFDAVVDGANVGLINEQEFNFFQLNSVVNRLSRMSPTKKMPLVILHQNRVNCGPARYPNNKKLLDSWRKSGVLYSTPLGSNDDWYWLYAAVSCKGLLVTNDEMRDHLFQLLGNGFFPRWKENHQVRLVVSKRGLTFHMPPPYSLVIQESEQGNWHVPSTVGDDIERPRQWLCIHRQRV